jgi:hypothetical protein
MADSGYGRLIQTAKERATSGFLEVVRRAMQDADTNIANALPLTKSGTERSLLAAARYVLRQDGNAFLRRTDQLFRTSLDRAMLTMYVDMRPDMRKLSIDELTLIDDEVVAHQIEVGRLTERIRDTNQEHVGRLNVIVARLHGEHEARERENPFRPYLLARALYDAVRIFANDESGARTLFEHLSNALMQHMSGYYSTIREVFEASGVRAQFVAQRSRVAHNQRYFGAPNPPDMPSQANAFVMPALGRLVETLQRSSGVGNGSVNVGNPGPTDNGEATNVQELLHRMLGSSKSFLRSQDGEFSLGRTPVTGGMRSARTINPLVAQLDQYQKSAAEGLSLNNALTHELNQLPALRDRIDLDGVPLNERVTIEVMAMLFEFILQDEQIPGKFREQIARLQIPLLKASVMDRLLMHDASHPARKLLNRMSSVAVGTDPESAGGQKLLDEIKRITASILAEFDTDTAVFANRLEDFERFLSAYVREGDHRVAAAIEAMAEAEKIHILLNNTTEMMRDILMLLNTDKRISDFLIYTWPQVLVTAAAQDAASGLAPDDSTGALARYLAVAPELLWSIQDTDASVRGALMGLLPDLVKRLRQGMAMIQLSEEEGKRILDQLVELHTAVLRGSAKEVANGKYSLDALRQIFAPVVLDWEHVSWGQVEPPQARAAVIEQALRTRGVAAQMKLGNTSASSTADRELMMQSCLVGARVAIATDEGNARFAQLAWVSAHRSLYLFKHDEDAKLALYAHAALLDGLRMEAIVPVERAPVFERAVESLLLGAGSLQKAPA